MRSPSVKWGAAKRAISQRCSTSPGAPRADTPAKRCKAKASAAGDGSIPRSTSNGICRRVRPGKPAEIGSALTGVEQPRDERRQALAAAGQQVLRVRRPARDQAALDYALGLEL